MLVANVGTNDFQITGGQVTAMVGTTSDYWSVQQFGPDSEAWVTVAVKPAADGEMVALDLRLQNPGLSTGNGYQGYFYNRTGTDQYQIYKRVSGSPVSLVSVTGPELQVGDQLLFRAVGTALELWLGHAGSWTKVVSASDSTYKTAGYIGLTSKNNVVRLDDFGGGTYH